MVRYRKLLIIAITSVITFYLVSPAASEEVVVLPGFAIFNYEKSVKLKAKGCQIILIQYETEDSLPRENTGMAVLIDNQKPNDGIAYAVTGWFSKLSYKNAPNALFVWPRAGELGLKVCRNNWSDGTGTSKSNFLKVSPGKYEITFSGFYIDEVLGKRKNDILIKSYIIFR